MSNSTREHVWRRWDFKLVETIWRRKQEAGNIKPGIVFIEMIEVVKSVTQAISWISYWENRKKKTFVGFHTFAFYGSIFGNSESHSVCQEVLCSSSGVTVLEQAIVWVSTFITRDDMNILKDVFCVNKLEQDLNWNRYHLSHNYSHYLFKHVWFCMQWS